MMRRTDIPNDYWQVVPNSAFSEFPDDPTPCSIGGYSWTELTIPNPWSCWDENDEPLCDTSPVQWHTVTQFGSAGLALPCGEWEIRYFLSRYPWDNMYELLDPGHWLRQSQSVLSGSRCAWSRGGDAFPIPLDIEAQADSQAIASTTLFFSANYCDTLPPPSNIQLKFIKYIFANGQSADEWLPAPNDSVGLVFSWNSAHIDSVNMRHNISRISMWAGQSMNAPYAAKGPEQSNFDGEISRLDTSAMNGRGFEHFDVWVGRPLKYKLYVKDIVDTLTLTGQRARPQTPRENTTNYSIGYIRADKQWNDSTGGDTLWVRSHDYAAYCEVLTEVWGRDGKKSFVSNHVTEFGKKSLIITVPRDDDGLSAYNYGFSQGDYMADYWETEHCQCPDIRKFHPFQPVDSVSADKDSLPEGRKRDGDNFANWEEYRGFMVYSDSSEIHSAHKHLRTDPTRKTFIAKIDTSIDDFLAPGLPSYWTSWTEPQLLFTDSAYSDDKMIARPLRFSQRKDIDTNRVGSFAFYPPLRRPVDNPLLGSESQQILMFTRFLPVDSQRSGGWSGNSLAVTLGGGSGSDGAQIPSRVLFISVVNERIDSVFSSDYYVQNHDTMLADRKHLLQWVITHELGHCVDMTHYYEGIMDTTIETENERVLPLDSSFAIHSKGQFSIKLEGQQP